MTVRRTPLVAVSQLVRRIKTLLEGNEALQDVMVKGEISNLRRPASGHWYFSLKDDQAAIPCVMFRYQTLRVNFRPKDGDKVIVSGDVSVYEKEGRAQLIVQSMRPDGIGDLYARYQELLRKLQKEGLFDSSHKKPLPKYPGSIGLVTGNDTAARQDIYRTFLNRWPYAEITDYPAPVQGAAAAPKIIEALKRADQGGHDVILLVRGGGSIEDLWCFNDEALVRCIYQMHTPVVTGVGHETDTTAVDYAADAHANTPTGAVELAAPDYHAVHNELMNAQRHMIRAVDYRLSRYQNTFDTLSSRPCLKQPMRLVEEKEMRLDTLRERLLRTSEVSLTARNRLNEYMHAMKQLMSDQSSVLRTQLNNDVSALRLSAEKAKLKEESRLRTEKNQLLQAVKLQDERKRTEMKHTMALLDAYSPLKVLERGYSVVSKEGHVISSAADLHVKDEITVRMADGQIRALVKETEGKK